MSHRTSIEDLKLAGSTNLGRALRYPPAKTKPSFQPGVPEMPKDFSAAEKEVWRQVTAILSERKTLTAGDAFTIARYATLEARRQKQQALLDEEGMLVNRIISTGYGKNQKSVTTTITNPRLRIVQACERSLLSLDVELGLTPRRRASALPTAPTAADPDSVESLLAELDSDLGKTN